MGDIDFSQGGYGGEIVEETFSPFTKQHMEYWWHFREILRALQSKPTSEQKCYWWKKDKNPLLDDEWRNLIAISQTHYAVYTNIADSIVFFNAFNFELHKQFISNGERILNVRRSWKAMYSSLYSAITALSNVVCMIVASQPHLKSNGRNYDPSEVVNDYLKNNQNIADLLKQCLDRTQIRNHLDHYHLIWSRIGQGHFYIDRNFTTKGYRGHVVIDQSDIDYNLDALQHARNNLIECAQDFNLIYKEITLVGNYLDTYLHNKGWMIDYSDFGPPHNGQRPKNIKGE